MNDTPANYAQWDYTFHTIHLGSPPEGKNSYIRIMVTPSGISLNAYGRGEFFENSRGMCGSWSTGGVRFQDGTQFDTSGGYFATQERSPALAKDWMVPESDSLMEPSSAVCDASSSCGQSGDTFQCEDTRRLQNVECDKTCSDIGIPLFREQCELDIQLTGDLSWACEPNYVDPVVTPSPVSSSGIYIYLIQHLLPY